MRSTSSDTRTARGAGRLSAAETMAGWSTRAAPAPGSTMPSLNVYGAVSSRWRQPKCTRRTAPARQPVRLAADLEPRPLGAARTRRRSQIPDLDRGLRQVSMRACVRTSRQRECAARCRTRDPRQRPRLPAQNDPDPADRRPSPGYHCASKTGAVRLRLNLLASSVYSDVESGFRRLTFPARWQRTIRKYRRFGGRFARKSSKSRNRQ
jgi:hypothetical protein